MKLIISAFLLACFSLASYAQHQPEQELIWNKPVEPFKIVDNIYYVGAGDVTSYLITTPKGHILIDSGLPQTVPLIEQGVTKLGYKMTDIKIILNSHAHYDHAGGIAQLKKSTGAKFYASKKDEQLLKDGGKNDPNYADRFPFEAVTPDVTFNDGKKIKLGGTTLTANITPGHTPGCTTWTTTARDTGKKLNVAFICSSSAPGYKLIDNPKYPNIINDYTSTFERLKKLPVDVFLASHGGAFDMLEKIERMKTGAPNPFIDPEGYRAYLKQSEENFQNSLAAQREKLK